MSTQNLMFEHCNRERLGHWISRVLCGFVPFGTVRIANFIFPPGAEHLEYIRTLFGSRLQVPVCRSTTHQLLYLMGEKVLEERTLLKRYLQPGMHAVDVGANIGYCAALMKSEIGPSGHLTLIEPSQENLVELKRNAELNAWENCQIFECAVGASEALVGLRSGINSGVVAVGQGSSNVEMRTLDSVITECDTKQVDFIKIDVEGYEWDVLQGSRSTIEQERPIMFVEIHPLLIEECGGTLANILEFLSEYYNCIEYFDVAADRSLGSRWLSHLGLANAWRQTSVEGIAEDQLHVGRKFGTFWLVATNRV